MGDNAALANEFELPFSDLTPTEREMLDVPAWNPPDSSLVAGARPTLGSPRRAQRGLRTPPHLHRPHLFGGGRPRLTPRVGGRRLGHRWGPAAGLARAVGAAPFVRATLGAGLGRL
ncbi:hypothetical protein HPB47_008748 [Ixodes persulcatus]|uniref:Uncharacterized protein n=1 Tax=Ixodes persulcatus TaxID=34615 RepID=A0AC60P405_IXOPE|nr:hypothetical protein HPB47_008748 [Ixodes persulcatus]